MANEKIEFWKSHLNWFIPFVSELYPLNKFQLIQYEELLDWDRVKTNPFIYWLNPIYEVFKDKLDEAEQMESKMVDIFREIDGEIVYDLVELEYHRHEIYFRDDELINSKQIYWKNIEFVIYKKPKYDEDALMLLINKFDCGIEIGLDPFRSLYVPTRLLEETKEFMEWDRFSEYWGLNWSFELLKQFEEYWVSDKLIENHTAFNYCLKDDLDDEFIEKVLS